MGGNGTCQFAEHRIVGAHLALGDDALTPKRVGVEALLHLLRRIGRHEQERTSGLRQRPRQQEPLASGEEFAVLGAVRVTRRDVIAVSVEDCEDGHGRSLVSPTDGGQTIGSWSNGQRGTCDVSDSWQLGSRYVLDRRIGSGAMGQVWAGHDIDGHALAFKLLRPEMADDPSVVTRFLQERNLLVGLRSPHVIRVHDLVVEGPRLAIVMDYIAGPSLRGLLQQRGNLPPAEVASLGSRIASGLAAVHGAGVLHRDLKPENVLLDETTTGLEPKLADFGIASLAVTATGHVGTANVIGTPQYLAPELGDGQPSGRASDLYALGITLYEMACGVVPFTSDSPVALLRMHADHAPGRPAGVPDELWQLIAALVAKNPGERPHDAAAVAAQLADMAPRFAAMPAPAPLRTPPPSHLIGAPVNDVAGAHTPLAEASSHRRSIVIGAVLVVSLCLVALVAWLMLRDDGDAQRPGNARSSASSAPASSSGSSGTPVSLATVLAPSEGEKASALIDGHRYGDAVITRGFTRPTCTTPVRFSLDGRFTRLTVLAGYDDSGLSAVSGSPDSERGHATARLDGDTKHTVEFSPRHPASIDLDVRGARTITFEMRSEPCASTGDDTTTLALGGGKLTTR